LRFYLLSKVDRCDKEQNDPSELLLFEVELLLVVKLVLGAVQFTTGPLTGDGAEKGHVNLQLFFPRFEPCLVLLKIAKAVVVVELA